MESAAGLKLSWLRHCPGGSMLQSDACMGDELSFLSFGKEEEN